MPLQCLSRRSGKISTIGLVLISNLCTLTIVGIVVVCIWPRNPPANQPLAATSAATQPAATVDVPNSIAATENPSPSIQQPTEVAVMKPSIEAAAIPETTPLAVKTETSPVLTVAEIASAVEKSVVLIEAFDDKGQQLGMGTGFIVDADGRIATNYHVLDGCSRARITYYDKQTSEVTALRNWNHRVDLAILEPGESAAKPAALKLAASLPDRAAEVIAIGHPRGMQFTTTTGIVSAVYRTDELPAQFRQMLTAADDERWIQTTASIIGGSSGGPLVNTAGEVVGINTWTVNEAKLGFAIQVEPLRTLLSQPRETPAELASITAPYLTMQRLINDYNNRYQWFSQETAKVRTKSALDKLIAEKHPAPDFMRKLSELATKFPESPGVFWALQSICRIAQQSEVPASCQSIFEAAARQLAETYMDDSRLRGLVWEMRGSSNKVAWDLMRDVSQKCARSDTKGLACLSLALALQASNTTGQHSADAIVQLERIMAEFRDVPLGGKTLGAMAEDQLYVLKNLSIGSKAPNIEGKDANGNSLKLSDFEGKVVVLDFWADWCPHCVAMYPLERRLVKQLAKEPFALLGINTDGLERLQELIEKQTVTWQNWHDGQRGPITEQYRVESFPTLFVLDHDGIIRYRDVRGDQLAKAVKELVANVPADALSPEQPGESTDP